MVFYRNAMFEWIIKIYCLGLPYREYASVPFTTQTWEIHSIFKTSKNLRFIKHLALAGTFSQNALTTRFVHHLRVNQFIPTGLKPLHCSAMSQPTVFFGPLGNPSGLCELLSDLTYNIALWVIVTSLAAASLEESLLGGRAESSSIANFWRNQPVNSTWKLGQMKSMQCGSALSKYCNTQLFWCPPQNIAVFTQSETWPNTKKTTDLITLKEKSYKTKHCVSCPPLEKELFPPQNKTFDN